MAQDVARFGEFISQLLRHEPLFARRLARRSVLRLRYVGGGMPIARWRTGLPPLSFAARVRPFEYGERSKPLIGTGDPLR